MTFFAFYQLFGIEEGHLSVIDEGIKAGDTFHFYHQDLTFFGQANINSSPFVDNFPRVTLGGTFCCRVFGRGVITPYVKESQEQKAVQCCVHSKGTVYLIMSYTPPKMI
ncbi:hypothetical protein Hanom_Chr02g00101901 [Helianthus anomalus]